MFSTEGGGQCMKAIVKKMKTPKRLALNSQSFFFYYFSPYLIQAYQPVADLLRALRLSLDDAPTIFCFARYEQV